MNWNNYVMAYPDLVADYEKNWKNRGVSLSEYGQMHAKNDPNRLAHYQKATSGGGGGGSGGGGGGSSAAASAEAAYKAEIARQEAAAKKAEEERKALVKKNNASINAKFDERSKQFDEYGNKLFAHNEKMFNENADKARQEMNYALARTGQTTGTVGANSQKDMETMYQRGLSNLRNESTGMANQLKNNDSAMRNNLLAASASGNYNDAMMRGLTGVPGNMTTLNTGVGNQFSTLLGGIGGASMRGKNPFGGYY